MFDALLIIPAALGLSANQILTRTFQTKIQKSKNSINLYHLIITLTASLACFVLAIVQGMSFSLQMLFPAALFGVGFAGALLFLAKSMETGYMSLSTIIASLSLVLPVVFSWVVLGETIEPNAVAGLLLIMATLVLSSFSTAATDHVNLKKWIIFVSLAFVANGGCSIVQKQYIASNGKDDLMLFLAVGYLVAATVFGIVYLEVNAKTHAHFKERIKRPAVFFVIAISSGLCSVIANVLIGYLSDIISGGVLYPCVHGGRAVLVAATSFIIFRERVSKRKLIAIALGVAAIVLLNL